MGPQKIHIYYETFESKIGYRWFLGGRKHFGYYPLNYKKLSYTKAMDNMETELINRIGLPENSIILDAGCGMGRVASHLAQRKKWNITGIDILPWNLVEARKYAKKNAPLGSLRFIEASYEKLPFPDASFDAIYTMETFVHAEHPAIVLKELSRVLKPRGKLVQFEYEYQDDLITGSLKDRLDKVIIDSYMPGLFEFKFNQIEKYQIASGFAEVKTEDITAYILPMLKSFYKLAYIPYYVAIIFGTKPIKYVNARAAVEFYRTQPAWRYVIVSGKKAKNLKS